MSVIISYILDQFIWSGAAQLVEPGILYFLDALGQVTQTQTGWLSRTKQNRPQCTQAAYWPYSIAQTEFLPSCQPMWTITQPVQTLFLFKSIWIRPQGSQGCQKIKFFFFFFFTNNIVEFLRKYCPKKAKISKNHQN